MAQISSEEKTAIKEQLTQLVSQATDESMAWARMQLAAEKENLHHWEEKLAEREKNLEQVKAKHYDLIFLDHMMPEMDGVETLHVMKEMEDSKCKNVPVIILTANAVTGAKEYVYGFTLLFSVPSVSVAATFT